MRFMRMGQHLINLDRVDAVSPSIIPGRCEVAIYLQGCDDSWQIKCASVEEQEITMAVIGAALGKTNICPKCGTSHD